MQCNSITRKLSYALLDPDAVQNFGLIQMQSKRNQSV